MSALPARGRQAYDFLRQRGVATRTLGRLLNVHRSNITVMGESRGFNERHHDRLRVGAELVSRLPDDVPANEWLKSPHPGLAGRSPVDLISAYGGDAPLPRRFSLVPGEFSVMPKRRWWTTWLALVEVPATGLEAVMAHLRSHLPGQRGRGGDQHLTVDIRWAWPSDGYPSMFVIAEVGSLHEPRRADRRWEAIEYQPLGDNRAWFSLGHAQPLREALLTHWHSGFTKPCVGSSLNDSPVPMDHYDDWMFTKRTLRKPDAPPWTYDESNQIVRFVGRLADGGPRVPNDYWPFPSVRDGRKAELWTLWHPFEEDSLHVQRGGLYRYEWELLGRRYVNTAVRDRAADQGVDPGDPRAVRLLTAPEIRP